MTNPIAAQDEPHIRPFAHWLQEQSSGKTLNELSEGLHELISRVQDTEKKGSIVLKVTVAHDSKTGLLVVADQITLNLPEHDRPATVWYVDQDGNLTRNDPRQLPFEALREVPPPPGVDPNTGEILDQKAN